VIRWTWEESKTFKIGKSTAYASLGNCRPKRNQSVVGRELIFIDFRVDPNGSALTWLRKVRINFSKSAIRIGLFETFARVTVCDSGVS
jgi:hypothetical protein